MVVRVGIVDLRDLANRSSSPTQIDRFVALAGLVVEDERRHQFAPPRVLVAIVPSDREWMVGRARRWLAETDHVVLVRERDEEEDREIEADPDLRELTDEAWREVLTGLSIEVIDGLTSETCREAIERARAACEGLPPRDPPAPPSAADLELPSTPWSAYTTEVSSLSRLSALAGRLERCDGRVLLHVGGEGDAIDLSDPPSVFRLGPEELPPRPPRASCLELDAGWVHPGRTAIGRDPFHPIEWRNTRSYLYWWYVARGGVCFLSETARDYPCGPGGKIYGYDDNEPVQVTLAPDVSVCAVRFGHDVLVTSAVPIAWHRAREVDVAVFARDPRRAVFFAQDPANAGKRGKAEDNLLLEEARDLAPALAIGPDDRARYAVDLTFSVHRVGVESDLAHVGGPDGGYAVFDADHRLVRRASGRLLGGWFRWATFEHAGHYWREDLGSGERMRLGPVDPPPTAGAKVDVLAVPGTRNVLLVTEGHLRMI